MANNTNFANSEGTLFRGLDGKAYQVINGRNVEVPFERLMIEGLPPGTVGVNGGAFLPANWGASQRQNEGGSSSMLMVLGVSAVILLLLTKK